jgi:hypothetical protein
MMDVVQPGVLIAARTRSRVAARKEEAEEVMHLSPVRDPTVGAVLAA